VKIRTFPEADTRHGTTAGTARHKWLGEEPCEACRRAKAEYDERWRAAPKRRRDSRRAAKAQHLALKDLRTSHVEEYARLYQSHLARLKAEEQE
jgi:hypothetical protein